MGVNTEILDRPVCSAADAAQFDLEVEEVGWARAYELSSRHAGQAA